jgi:UDP:flavonoid glycosyltransferase YjiC (YdhE family)
MRVLVSCRPAYGHYTPMVPIALALGKAGHQLRFATAAPLDEVIRRDGFEVEAVGLSFDEIARARAHDPAFAHPDAARRQMRMLAFSRSFAAFEVPPRVEGLRRIMQAWRPDLLIHEMSEFAGPLAGALEGVPTVDHSFGPLVESDVMAAAGASAAVHWLGHGLSAPDRGGMYGGLYLDIAPPSLQFPHLATIPHVQSLRPVPLPLRNAEPAPWLAHLGKRPVVTVSFGTMFNNRGDLYRTVIEALGEAETDVVIATGRSEIARTLGTMPANIQVHAWVPWADLLARSSVVVCHGGASSTLGPLSFGLPLVIIPIAADHFTNAGLASRAGVATVLDSETITPAALREAVAAAFDKPARLAARRVAEEIAEMPAPEAVVPILTRLARG